MFICDNVDICLVGIRVHSIHGTAKAFHCLECFGGAFIH